MLITITEVEVYAMEHISLSVIIEKWTPTGSNQTSYE